MYARSVLRREEEDRCRSSGRDGASSHLGTSPFVLVVPPVLGHFELDVVLPRVLRVAFLPGKVASCCQTGVADVFLLSNTS